MIPVIEPYEAVFKVTKDGRTTQDRLRVVAWDDSGDALVVNYETGHLQAATRFSGFVRLQEARSPAIGVIPGGGWRAVFRDTPQALSVLAWTFNAHHQGIPLLANEEGFVFEVPEMKTFERLIPPGETPTDSPAPENPPT